MNANMLQTAAHIGDLVQLNNGVRMPWLGLGVFKASDGHEVERAVEAAIGAGYRSIDTAAAYDNETGVGQAVKRSGVPREQLFITTKLNNPDQGYESALAAFDRSLNKLGLEYIDLYLIHWPVKGKFIESWRALQKLYRDRRVRAIGVSNFQIHHLQDLIGAGGIVPAVNQVELHPCLTQEKLHRFCLEAGIQIQAWSPLMQGQLLDHPLLQELGRRYGKSVTQIILRWDLQRGIVTIPKSVKEDRILENADIFDFEMTSEEMTSINGLNQDKRVGPDPDNFDF